MTENMNRAGLAHHPETGPARPCLPTIANILRRRTTGGQGTNRARGASDCGAAMGVAAPQVAPGLRPAKRAAQPLTNSRPARFPTGAPGRLTDQRGDMRGRSSAEMANPRPQNVAAPGTDSGLARHRAHEGSPCKRLAGAAVLATGRAVPAVF